MNVDELKTVLMQIWERGEIKLTDVEELRMVAVVSLVKKQGDAAAWVGEDEVSDGGGGGARVAEEGVRGRRWPEEMKKT